MHKFSKGNKYIDFTDYTHKKMKLHDELVVHYLILKSYITRRNYQKHSPEEYLYVEL